MRLHPSVIILLGSAALLPGIAAAQAPAPLSYEKDIIPLMQKYCYQCHGDGKAKADLALDSYKNVEMILKDRAKWENVQHQVRTREMPPVEAKIQPTQAERDLFTNWIDTELFKLDPKNPDPGRVTIRRLNRAEYNNTIRDLVGVDFQAAEDFPSDDSGYGFDNIGDVLTLPPVLMEKYLSAATRVLDEAIVTQTIDSKVRKYKANLMEMGFNAVGDRGDGWMPLAPLEEDCLAVAINVPAGDYIIRAYAYTRGRAGGGAPGGGRGGRGGRGAATLPANANADDADNVEAIAAAQPATMPAQAARANPGILSVQIDDIQFWDWSVHGTEQAPEMYEVRVGVSAGRHRFKVLNRRIRGGPGEFTMQNGRLGQQQSATIMVKAVEIEGPIHGATRRYPATKLETKGEGKYLPDGTRLLDHEGEVATKFNVAKEGDYILRAQVYADQAGSDYCRMEMRLNGQTLNSLEISAPGQMVPLEGQRVFSMELLNPLPYVYEIRQKLKPGENRFAVAFVNDHTDPASPNPNLRDRNLYVQHLEVVDLSESQPIPPMPAPLAKYFAGKQITPETKQAAAKQILTDFTHRAWRRPVKPAERETLVRLDGIEPAGPGVANLQRIRADAGI